MPFKDIGSVVCELSARPQYISAKAKHQSAHSQNAFLRVRCSFRTPQQLPPSGITSFLQPPLPLRKLGIEQAAAAAKPNPADYQGRAGAHSGEGQLRSIGYEYLLHGLVALLRAAAASLKSDGNKPA